MDFVCLWIGRLVMAITAGFCLTFIALTLLDVVGDRLYQKLKAIRFLRDELRKENQNASN